MSINILTGNELGEEKHLYHNSILNKTHSDSLTNIIIPNEPHANTTSKKQKKSTKKENNFYQALNLIQKKSKKEQIYKEDISEFSESNVNASKEENILFYINNPITKTIEKHGNFIIKNKIFPDFYNGVNRPYNTNVMTNIIEMENEEEEIKNITNVKNNKITKRPYNTYNVGFNNYYKGSTTANTICNANLGDYSSINGTEAKAIIGDLDEIQDVKVTDYYNDSKQKGDNKNNNSISKSNSKSESFSSNNLFESRDKCDIEAQLDNQNDEKIYIVDSIGGSDLISPRETNNSLIKQLNFNDKEDPNSEHKDDINYFDFPESRKSTNTKINCNNLSLENNGKHGEQLLFDSESSLSEDEKFTTPKTKNRKFKIGHIAKTIKYRHKPTKSNQFKNSLLLSKSHQYSKSKLSVSELLEPINHETDNDLFESAAIYDATFLFNLIQQNKKYKIKSDFLSAHPSISWYIRAEVISNIIQLSETFGFKRDTCHLGIYNTDRYLSITKNKSEKDLHLIALTSLSIAAKIEEVQIPIFKDYVTIFYDGEIELQELILMEQKMLTSLKWQAIPNSINTWLNWHLCQWDLFIDSVDGVKDLFLLDYGEDQIVYFKKKDDPSYYNYRRIGQLIDLFSLDVESYKYTLQYLVVGAILCVLLDNYSDNGVIDENKNYIKVFKQFVEESFGEKIYDSEEFKKAIKYCCELRGIEYNFEIPLYYQTNEIETEKGSYEDFITYQTYNETLLPFLQSKKVSS